MKDNKHIKKGDLVKMTERYMGDAHNSSGKAKVVSVDDDYLFVKYHGCDCNGWDQGTCAVTRRDRPVFEVDIKAMSEEKNKADALMDWFKNG